jgi:hypothetical protein
MTAFYGNGRVGVSGDDIIHEVEEFDAPPARLVRGGDLAGCAPD